MVNPEAFLKAYITNLANHGQVAIPVTILLDKIEDAFHKHEADKDLNADEKKLYYDLIKEV